MRETTLMTIRFIATLTIICGTYSAGLYILGRVAQLSNEQSTVEKVEINNPRLDKALLNKINQEFDNRKIYSENENVEINITEKDPFYQ